MLTNSSKTIHNSYIIYSGSLRSTQNQIQLNEIARIKKVFPMFYGIVTPPPPHPHTHTHTHTLRTTLENLNTASYRI